MVALRQRPCMRRGFYAHFSSSARAVLWAWNASFIDHEVGEEDEDEENKPLQGVPGIQHDAETVNHFATGWIDDVAIGEGKFGLLVGGP
jgi:hypothetical protein